MIILSCPILKPFFQCKKKCFFLKKRVKGLANRTGKLCFWLKNNVILFSIWQNEQKIHIQLRLLNRTENVQDEHSSAWEWDLWDSPAIAGFQLGLRGRGPRLQQATPPRYFKFATSSFFCLRSYKYLAHREHFEQGFIREVTFNTVTFFATSLSS